jgi:hypothetical protein
VAGNTRSYKLNVTDNFLDNLFMPLVIGGPVTVAEQLARKQGSWVRIPLMAWMFIVCGYVCVFLCLCTGRGLATS